MTNIISNNHFRSLFSSRDYHGDWKELRAQYDYMSESYFNDEARFFEYRGRVYSLDNFTRCFHGDMRAWDYILSETGFSGIVIQLFPNCVVVGRYCD